MRARLLAVAALTSGLLWVAAPAFAHAGFVSSQPEPGATLGTAPGVVVLRFSEPLNKDLSSATVLTPDGHRVEGTATGDEEITVDLSTNSQGVYEVDWRTVSTVDGHTLLGMFQFGVGVPAGASREATTSEAPRATDLLISIGRVIEDTALLLAIGILLVGQLARSQPELAWVRARPTIAIAVALLGGTSVVLGEALAAAPRPSVSAVVTYLTTGLPGLARLVRPALEAAALLSARSRPRRAAIPIAAAVAALAAAGHAAAVHPQWWGIAVEAVHVGAAGFWAGGILAMAFQRPPAGWRSAEGHDLLDRFAPVALFAFAATATAGVIRGAQEVGSIHGLFGSSYGALLLVKALLVFVMAQLSVYAWRRIFVRPGIEAGVAVAVLVAAALLAAYPLPPSRLAEAEQLAKGAAVATGLPASGDLTLGAHAGQFLVGLSLPPGADEVLVFVRGLESDQDTAARRVEITAGGTPLDVAQCGPTCRSAAASIRSGEEIDVTVDGEGGGTARFAVPQLSARSADDLVAQMMTRMHALTSYRLQETLTSGIAEVRSTYAFVAPNEFESHVTEQNSGADIVWVGDTRYLRELPGGSWQVDVGASPTVPAFVWDSFRPFSDARLIGRAVVDGTKTDIVAFFGGDASLPVWFKLWIDRSGLVHQAEMRAQGHFMDHRYYGFDQPISIQPPKGVSP